MSSIVVIYQSKYGATKKYAEWLAEELSGDLRETKKVTVEQIEKYDVIILDQLIIVKHNIKNFF